MVWAPPLAPEKYVSMIQSLPATMEFEADVFRFSSSYQLAWAKGHAPVVSVFQIPDIDGDPDKAVWAFEAWMNVDPSSSEMKLNGQAFQIGCVYVEGIDRSPLLLKYRLLPEDCPTNSSPGSHFDRYIEFFIEDLNTYTPEKVRYHDPNQNITFHVVRVGKKQEN
jgi:hypothetical protein